MQKRSAKVSRVKKSRGARLYSSSKKFISRNKELIGITLQLFATVIAIASIIYSYQASHRTMIAANRAWIEPRELSLTSHESSSNTISMTLVYANIGKEPAIDVVIQAEPKIIFSSINSNADWYRLMDGQNGMCEKARPNGKGLIVYPNAVQPLNYNFGLGSQIFASDEAATLVVEGCVGYRTFERPHESGFCFFIPRFNSSGSRPLKAIACPTHNHAR